MSLTLGLAVALGGALGAALRFTVARWVTIEAVPGATLAVNVTGSFALGILVGVQVPEPLMAFFGVGVCGALTTFSSFAVETVSLWERGEVRRATAYALGTLILAALAVGIGWGIGIALG